MKHRILVVDDLKENADILGLLLEDLGNEVQLAYSGEDALRQAEQFRPDVVLLDLSMPDMRGPEVARHIRAQPWGKRMTLVALTGWSCMREADQLEAVFNQHLLKPVGFAELERMLATAGPPAA